MSSRQLLDQEQFEQKLDHILRRQSDARAALDHAQPMAGRPERHRLDTQPRARPRARPRRAPRQARTMNDPILAPARSSGQRLGMDGARRVAASLDRIEQRQAAALNSIEESYDAKARRIRGVLASSASSPARSQSRVPAPPADRSCRCVHRPDVNRSSHSSSASATRARRSTGSPARSAACRCASRWPATSIRLVGFGVRSDPSSRSPAMHTGLDFKGESGDTVRATANGTVTAQAGAAATARWSTIDHGNGFTTRYGHLSSIDVQVGRSVKIGQRSAGSARPAARPVRTCITRRGCVARRSTH
jgi:septal ring factor EnvC (AmiA/AmiB activator)